MSTRPRITVVNDHPDFLELMNDILEDERYPTTVIDGDRPGTLEEIVASTPELLIIDLRLGSDGLHGWDVVQGVRKIPALRELPILVCSGDLAGLAAAEEELNAGSHIASIQKPFGIGELLAAIDGLLGTEPAA